VAEKFIIILWAVTREGSIPVQRRANEESGEDGKLKPQSFPGVLQPLVAGKGKEGESPVRTLLRETEEEAGGRFAEILDRKINCNRDFRKFSEKEYSDKKGILTKNYNYLVNVSEEDLKEVRLHVGADPGLIFLRKEDLEKIKTTKEMDGKEIGSFDLVMFPDHLSALKEIVGQFNG